MKLCLDRSSKRGKEKEERGATEKKTRNNIARLQKQVETGKTGGDLPLQPMQPAPSAPRVTKRLNPATGKIESVTGE